MQNLMTFMKPEISGMSLAKEGLSLVPTVHLGFPLTPKSGLTQLPVVTCMSYLLLGLAIYSACPEVAS